MLYKSFYVENKYSNLYISMSILFHLNTASFFFFLIHRINSVLGGETVKGKWIEG